MADHNVTLTLTASEAEALKVKLQVLMDEAKGVDIWLAPGGEADVEGGQECFLDCDEEAHYHLGNILEKLGGQFTPHRESGFHNPLEVNGTAKAGTANPEHIWVVFQRCETKPIEELPITGVYDTRERAVDGALGYLSSIDNAITSPSYVAEDEIIWKFQVGEDEAECVALRMTKNF